LFDLGDPLAAIADFVTMIEAVILRALAMRVVAEDGLRFFNEAVRLSADVTCRYVNKLRPDVFRETDYVLHTVNIRREGVIDGREELYEAGTVDDCADPSSKRLQRRRFQAAPRTADVAVPDGDVALQNVAAASVLNLLGSRHESGRSKRVRVEAISSGKGRTSTEKNMQVLEIRETIQDQAKQDLSQEPVNSRDQKFVIAESFRHLCAL
jgi:hypothetical protein